jgi:hypothetical protein
MSKLWFNACDKGWVEDNENNGEKTKVSMSRLWENILLGG